MASSAEIAAKLVYPTAMIHEETIKDIVPNPTAAARTEIAMDRRQARAALLALNANVLGEHDARTNQIPPRFNVLQESP